MLEKRAFSTKSLFFRQIKASRQLIFKTTVHCILQQTLLKATKGGCAVLLGKPS